MTETVQLSITELVRLACASGDLIHTGPAGPTAQQGQRAHKRHQARQPPHWQAEVAIQAEVELDGWRVQLGGRVDLMDTDAEPPELVEIKSCLAPPDLLPDSSRDQHWAQLFFYGYCHLLLHPELEHIALGLHWVNIGDDALTREERRPARDEVLAFCEQALRRYLRLHALAQRHREAALASAQTLAFPFGEFRSGQRTMATATYRCIRDGGRLLSEAPTGIGKTISVLFPAAKAFAEGHCEQVFFLTAKNSGRQAADRTLRALRDSGLDWCSVQLSAKKQLCHCSNGSCERNAEGYCPLTLGFFDRLPAAREELIGLRHIDTAALDAAAHRHQLCPFELSLQMIQWADLVICDYNYLFDPLVRLPRVLERSARVTLLIDEAHNLVDRARAMYSADLTLSASRLASRQAQEPLLARRFDALARTLARAIAPLERTEVLEHSPETIGRAVERCLESFGEQLERKPLQAELGEWFKTLFRYKTIDELFAKHHRTLLHPPGTDAADDAGARLACLNATDKLVASMASFQSVVAFSATLSPAPVYRRELGLPEDCLQQRLPSPFAPEQLGCFVCADIDTRWALRQRSEPALIRVIEQVYRARPGNYLVFFPSYRYLEDTLAAFTAAHPDIPTLAQGRDADPSERERFRQHFEQAGELLGFAILGGIYSEGVDFVGESLLGAIVVGTGLAATSTENRLIQGDYEEQGLDGFEYAFTFPGMTRVLQAAGRVIRSEHDKGIVVLADRRFTQALYRDLMPPHWRPHLLRQHALLGTELQQFWRE